MSNNYKGYPIPEIMQDENLYHIICDEGVFEGYSQEAVLSHWRNKVDTIYRLQAVTYGYTHVDVKSLDMELLSCPDCGSVVIDVYTHTKFHENLTD